MTAPRQPRRLFSLRSFVRAMVAGIVLNVLVAWSIAALVNINAWTNVQVETRTDGQFAWPYPTREGWPPHATRVYQLDRLGYSKLDWRMASMPGQRASFPNGMEQARFGWPMLCLSYTWPRDLPLHQKGIHYPNNQDGALPLDPFWGGFLLNSAFYAALAFAASAAVSRVRIHRRRRRGQCIACRYPLAGLAPGTPCPECGTVATAVPRPT